MVSEAVIVLYFLYVHHKKDGKWKARGILGWVKSPISWSAQLDLQRLDPPGPIHMCRKKKWLFLGKIGCRCLVFPKLVPYLLCLDHSWSFLKETWFMPQSRTFFLAMGWTYCKLTHHNHSAPPAFPTSLRNLSECFQCKCTHCMLWLTSLGIVT